MIDTETTRYVWDGNEWLLLVLGVSKSARLSHMRFLLNYALTEFVRIEIPKNSEVGVFLKKWSGAPGSFRKFESFLDELIDQFEETDESLVAGKAMDCLAVYSHLFKAILSVKLTKKKRVQLMKAIEADMAPLVEANPFLSAVIIHEDGIDVLAINPYECAYSKLRDVLEKMLQIVAENTKKIATVAAFRKMLHEHTMPYVKRDMERLQMYAILDDVIRYLF